MFVRRNLGLRVCYLLSDVAAVFQSDLAIMRPHGAENSDSLTCSLDFIINFIL